MRTELTNPLLSQAGGIGTLPGTLPAGMLGITALPAIQAQKHTRRLLDDSAQRFNTQLQQSVDAQLEQRQALQQQQAQRRQELARTQSERLARRPNYIDPDMLRQQTDRLTRSM